MLRGKFHNKNDVILEMMSPETEQKAAEISTLDFRTTDFRVLRKEGVRWLLRNHPKTYK